VVLYLRILGVAPDEPWSTYDYFQEVVAGYLLPRFQGADLARGAQDVMKDEEGMAGAARWLLGENGWQNLEESEREHVLSPLARQALQHHDMNTRKEVMHTLSYFNRTWSAKLLQGMLSRPTDPNWTPRSDEFGRRINFAGGIQVSANECSDAAWAAFCLARIGDVQSLPALQKLAEESRGRDKDLFQKALQLLRDTAGKAPADPK
jgi:hypothetical protein